MAGKIRADERSRSDMPVRPLYHISARGDGLIIQGESGFGESGGREYYSLPPLYSQSRLLGSGFLLHSNSSFHGVVFLM